MRGDFGVRGIIKQKQNLDRIGVLIGTEQADGFKLAFGITNEHPTNGQWWDWRLVPKRCTSSYLHFTVLASIPRDGLFLPHGLCAFQPIGQLWLSRAFDSLANTPLLPST